MSDKKDPQTPDIGLRLYQVICFTALGAIFLVQAEMGFGLENLLVAAVGALGTLMYLRATPFLVLVVLAVAHLLRQIYWRPAGSLMAFQFQDLVLCAAVLVFVAGHFRLQSLALNVVPLDPRRQIGPPRWHWGRLRRVPPLEPHGRSPTLVTPTEITAFLLAPPLCALLAQLLWWYLRRQGEIYGFSAAFSRMLVAGWVLGLGLLVLNGLYRFWKHRGLTPTEATLFLQDTLWRETRREQRRQMRWLAWRNLRAKEKR